MRSISSLPGLSEPRFVEVPEPAAPGDGEVLCRTLELGVCGTDREILASKNPLLPPGSDHLTLGHECLACIEAVGSGVSDLSFGDLVVPVVRRATVESSIRVDLLALGEYVESGIFYGHGFSVPLFLDRPEHLFKVDGPVTEVAVLTEPLTVAEKGVNEALAVERARIGANYWTDPPPTVLVTGMGPIGFAGVIACRARGWPVVMYGRDPADSFRAELAVRLGATYLRSDDWESVLPERDSEGFDLVLECTGSEEVMLRAGRLLRARGVMVWLGSSSRPQPQHQNVGRLMRDCLVRNVALIGSVNAAPRDFVDALAHLEAMLKTHTDELRALITARIDPGDALWHYENREPQGIKTILDYR